MKRTHSVCAEAVKYSLLVHSFAPSLCTFFYFLFSSSLPLSFYAEIGFRPRGGRGTTSHIIRHCVFLRERWGKESTKNPIASFLYSPRAPRCLSIGTLYGSDVYCTLSLSSAVHSSVESKSGAYHVGNKTHG